MFLCLFNFRAFSFWTWFTFILVVLSYQLGGKTHPLYLLQPGGELLGAAACGGMAAPKKGDRNQGIDATHTDAARQHFAMCTISGVNPRISDTFHRSTTSSPVCRYPYCRGWGNLGRKSLWGYSALHNLGHLGVIRWDFIFVSYWLFPWYVYSSQETGARLVSTASLQWRGKWSESLEELGKGHCWRCHAAFYFFYWGLERVYLAGTEVSVYIWWTKIISSSEKHCIGNIKRKQGPLIISISARTRDSIHGRSRDFSGAKEIFPWLPVHPVMAKGEGGISNVQFSDVHLQGERQLNGDVRTCLVSQGNSLLYVYLACVDIWKLFWATTANLIHGLFSLQSIVP